MTDHRTMIQSLTGADLEEVRPLCWAFLYFFCLLCGYYILRPVRDEMAIEGGVQHLPWMMTATFATMLVATPLFGYVSARVSRERLLLTVYAFFASHLVGFFLLMSSHVAPQWIARVFFVWLSVFNLFVVSVFWSFMADIFRPEQGTRLFSIIAAGGSTGAMVGPLVTTGLTYLVPIPALMLVSAALLGMCWFCIRALDRWSKQQPGHAAQHVMERRGEAIGGSMWAGMRLALSSPYLLGICAYLFFLTTTATFLYLEQTRLVGEQVASAQGRTRLFAVMDLAVNVLTFLAQLFDDRTHDQPLRVGIGAGPAAHRKCRGICGHWSDADLIVVHSLYDRAARGRVCHREARSRGTLYRPQPRRKVQGQELHRHSGLARR